MADRRANFPILRLTASEFAALPDYSCSLPTGTTIGKRWRRLDGSHDRRFIASGGKPRWIVGEYTRDVVTSNRVVVGDRGPDPAGPLVNLRCMIDCQVEIRWHWPVIVATAIQVRGVRGGIYVASKTAHAPLWQHHRAIGVPIISTWIDEAGPGESADLADLWRRCIAEASTAAALVLYRRADEVLKGAWAEVGAALASGVPVFAHGIDEFSIRHAPGLTQCASLAEAVALAIQAHDRARFVRRIEDARHCDVRQPGLPNPIDLSPPRGERHGASRDCWRGVSDLAAVQLALQR